ncbi:hypothetical protein PHYPSEUDO_009492 [Phytophthora pseudosyringae]|uniref:PH domain-containing protein n=1 Tax=Phytophthora pseudosyringae TaxID=221518 RepID=A0A8T1VCK2_9STRA|nr:hypothetical protein PHYPSEUDO_009492 [Phytophthora pseudosyringae]
MMRVFSPSSRLAQRERRARGSSSRYSDRDAISGRSRNERNNVGGTLQPINPRAHASVTTVPNNEASLYMDDFCLDTPSFVTLASAMKMRVCEVFWLACNAVAWCERGKRAWQPGRADLLWCFILASFRRRVQMQLICSREPSSDQLRKYSAVLCVRRRRRHGCIGSSAVAISLDRRMHPVKMLSTKAKDSRKLTIGIEYGWRSKHVWFRAPNVAVYEQWNDVIRAALQGNGGAGFDEEESLAKWVERSGISMMETATTSGVGRCSTDSYLRGCSSSYRSDIPDDEWSGEGDAARRVLYQLQDSSTDDPGTPAERNHRVSMASLCTRYRSNSREHTDTVIWMGRPAFSFAGPDNMLCDGS